MDSSFGPSAPSPSKSNSVWELINELAQKRGITEIIINGPQSIFIEKEGQLLKLDFQITLEDILGFVQDMAAYNRTECHEDHPILDGNLPDGSRINIIYPPYTKNFPAITIRRYLKSIQKFDGAPGIFGLNEPWVYFIKSMIQAKVNMIVSGGTGVGKTTFLNLMLQEVSKKERIVTIEDTRELNFQHPNHIQLETGGAQLRKNKLTMRDLVKNTLRMRPDRIIIGEVRGGEVFDMLQAMNTGHDGSMASIHANSPAECLKRISTLYLVAGHEVPLLAIREQIASAIQFIIQLSRTPKGERVVSKISELTGMEGPNFLLQDIGIYTAGKLRTTGIVPECIDRLVRFGLPRDYFNSDF